LGGTREEHPVARLSIRLLGPFLAERDGEPLRGFRSAKVRALLAYLCVESHRPWSRATLASLLWPDLPEESAQSDLRNALSNLRLVLAGRQTVPTFLHISRDTVQFNSSSDCWLDVRAFLSLLTKAGQGEDLGLERADLASLQQAVELYRGDFLEGFALASTPFEEWMLIKSQQIREKLLQAVRGLALGYMSLGDPAASGDFTRRWIELEPWEEAAHRHMMRLLALCGRRSAALAQYQACRQNLRQELGIEPEAETVLLYEQLREGRFSTGLATLCPSPAWPGLETGGLKLVTDPAEEEPTLFVARSKELKELAGAFERAVAGRGGVYFVTGGPGSGKTALLAEFARRAMARDPQLLVAWGQCNAFTGQGDPCFPFLTIARMLVGEVAGPVSARRISRELARRLWQRLPATVNAMVDHGPDLIDRFFSGRELLALARLHGCVKHDCLRRLQWLLEQLEKQPIRVRQAALFEQFTRVLCALAQRQPLALVVDDMQWIDPGSVNLFFHVARRIADSKILLLGAYRPEEVALLAEAEPHPLSSVIGELRAAGGNIIDLAHAERETFVAALIDSEPNELGEDFRAMLYRHTSGNPLFSIELLRGMQLRGELRRNQQERWVEGPQLKWNELPARVEAVIGRRIGHLSPACRQLLIAASAEGEQFTAQVIADLLQKDVQQVCELLSREAGKQHRLVIAQSMRRIGGHNLALYRFRHVLFQIYLYDQLDVVERARLHGLVARRLEEIYRESLDQFPEIIHSLARHFEAAGLPESAVQYYTRAGKKALCLSANREAIAHFQGALSLLRTLPMTPDRDRQELDLQLSIGPPLTAIKGWAAPEIAAAYGRVQELCEKIDDHRQLIPALWLLAVFHLGRSQHATVGRLVEQLLRLARQAGDPALLALANLQVSPFYQGRFAEARRLLERAGAAPDIEQQRYLALQYGMAPAVVALAYLAECLWLLGFPDQAGQCGRQARKLAEQVQHPMANCYALGRACWMAALMGECDSVRDYATALAQVARKFQIENFTLAARFFQHWAAIRGEAPGAEGIPEMYQAMEDYRATGTLLNRTAFLVLFGQACGRAGETARGLAAVDESLALAGQTGEFWFQAEAWRVKGELLRRQAENQAGPGLRAAEKCFETARQLAGQQEAKSLELRAAVSLCLLWQSQSKEKRCLDLLLTIVGQFGERLDTTDMRLANRLLHQLRR
jgi:DNA-binding SARP family transcriptional activator